MGFVHPGLRTQKTRPLPGLLSYGLRPCCISYSFIQIKLCVDTSGVRERRMKKTGHGLANLYIASSPYPSPPQKTWRRGDLLSWFFAIFRVMWISRCALIHPAFYIRRDILTNRNFRLSMKGNRINASHAWFYILTAIKQAITCFRSIVHLI